MYINRHIEIRNKLNEQMILLRQEIERINEGNLDKVRIQDLIKESMRLEAQTKALDPPANCAFIYAPLKAAAGEYKELLLSLAAYLEAPVKVMFGHLNRRLNTLTDTLERAALAEAEFLKKGYIRSW